MSPTVFCLYRQKTVGITSYIAGDWDETDIWECFLSLRVTSSYMQLDLLRSPRDCDLRSNFEFDLSRSCHICFDAH